MPISELVRVARTVTEDGSSELALRAARAWRYDHVQFLRSSANHVFVCRAEGRAVAVLRLRPEAAGERERSQRVAQMAAGLAAAGAPCVPAVTTADGEFTSSVVGDDRRYVASLLVGASGEQLEAESPAPEQARAWGRGLARLHEAGGRFDAPKLSRWVDAVGDAAKLVSDPGLRNVADAIVGALAELPTSETTVGLVHGDPELDNVIWLDNETPIFIDLDDASWSWFAADICFALRDFAPRAAAPNLGSTAVAAFLAGYRAIRQLEADELAPLPLFARAHALITLARLEQSLVEPLDPNWPDWAIALRRRLDAVASELRTALTI
jgi:Ser/Thr protein kinase RdoA (MazF antagonist)